MKDFKQVTGYDDAGEPIIATDHTTCASVSNDLLSNWQTIETAATDGSHMQLYRPEIQFVGYYSSAGWIINAPGLPIMFPHPTHWKPLDDGPNGR